VYLPEDGPDGPKHVGVLICNKYTKSALVGDCCLHSFSFILVLKTTRIALEGKPSGRGQFCVEGVET
jgi:hypothetical protein